MTFFGFDESNFNYLQTIRLYLYLMHVAEFGQGETGTFLDWQESWSVIDHSNDCPRQTDGHSCGVFILLGMYHIAHGLELMPSTFTQEGIITANVRMRIALILWSYRTGNEFEADSILGKSDGVAYGSLDSCLHGTENRMKLSKPDRDEIEMDQRDLSEVGQETECGDPADNTCSILPASSKTAAREVQVNLIDVFHSAVDQDEVDGGEVDLPHLDDAFVLSNLIKVKTRRMTKAERKAALRARLKKRAREAPDSVATKKSTPIDFSNFDIPIDDPLSQRIEAFDDDGKNKTILSYMIDDVKDNHICCKCLDLAMSPMKLGCCNSTCCFSCLSTTILKCPVTSCKARSGSISITYASEIEDTMKSLRIHCPSGCGWYGTLNEYPEHSSLHCYQYDSSVRIDSLNVKRFDRSHINEEIHNIAIKAKQLQLEEELDIRTSYASTLFISQCEKIHKIAQMMDSVTGQIHKGDDAKNKCKEQRDKESKAANIILQHKAKSLEALSNSFSSKTFGGGVHQTFDFKSWQQIHQWMNFYATLLFGDIGAFQCVDIGAGVLLAVISGAAVNNKMHWVGLEIDPNRLYLGTEIYNIFLNEWQNISDLILHVAFLQADCTKPLNLRG